MKGRYNASYYKGVQMEEVDMAWLDVFVDELSNDLIDDAPAFVAPMPVAPRVVEEEEASVPCGQSVMNNLISTLYSGPTITEVESALSSSLGLWNGADTRGSIPRPAILMPEKGMGKSAENNNKYTLRVRSSGSTLADDGYKWRKYGQKSIKNSPNPRSYYRCTNPRCSAKKQVERSPEDPDTLVVTYEGLHLHYAYSHFLLLPRPPLQDVLPASKKPKTAPTAVAAEEDWQGGPQGLLEDVVQPWMVRKPSPASAPAEQYCASYSQESSPSISSSSFSWSPAYGYLDDAILSDIITSL